MKRVRSEKEKNGYVDFYVSAKHLYNEIQMQ